MKHFIAYLTIMLLTWALLAIIVAVVFNIMFTMHPSDVYYALHHDYMSLVACTMGLPAWVIAGRIVNKLRR